MRVAFNAHLMAGDASYRRTGVSRYIEQLLTALPAALAAGDELLVFGRPGVSPTPDLVGTWHTARLPTGRPPVRIVWEQTVLPWQAWRGRSDILHGPLNVVPALTSCPAVVTIHDLGFIRYPELVPASRRRYLAAATRFAARHAARIITVSASTKQDVIELLGAPPPRITVIPLAADRSFHPLDPETLASFRPKQLLEHPYILSVGTLEPRKNLPVLLQAFAAIAPDLPHDLVLAGAEGWLTESLQATLRSLAIRDRVRLTGFVPAADLPAWYGAADLFVFPSLFEGFGLPPLEAMACGTPVIASAASAMPEVVGDAAVTFDPADAEALAAAIHRVLGDPALAASLRQRGLARAAGFSWERTAAATVAVYREAAG